MLTSGTISTIAGKLVAGPVCAALGPKHVGWLSLLACALPLVTASNGYSVLVAWNIARFGQSMTWPVTNILFDAWFPSDEQGKAWGVMGTSSRAGILSLTLALNLFGDGLDTAALFSTYLTLLRSLVRGVQELCAALHYLMPANIPSLQDTPSPSSPPSPLSEMVIC